MNSYKIDCIKEELKKIEKEYIYSSEINLVRSLNDQQLSKILRFQDEYGVCIEYKPDIIRISGLENNVLLASSKISSVIINETTVREVCPVNK